MEPRLVALSGTPGTGKSTLAHLASVRLGVHLVDLGVLAKECGALTSYDGARKSWDVDLERLQQAVEGLPRQQGTSLLVGHAAHLLDVPLVVVLRTDPRVLRERLGQRGWPTSKVDENVEAETLDTITIEAVEERGIDAVVELDTSSAGIEVLLEQLQQVLAGERAKYRPGGIDYSGRLLESSEGRVAHTRR